MEDELKLVAFFFIFTEINCMMKKLISTILLLYSFVILSQETNSNNFDYNPFEFSIFNIENVSNNDKTNLKNHFSELTDDLKTLDELQNKLPKLTFGKKSFFYTKDEFTGLYNVYSTINGEVKLYQRHFSTLDFTPTCAMPGPVTNADAGDLAGALIRSFLSDMDLKIKVGKRHTISFF